MDRRKEEAQEGRTRKGETVERPTRKGERREGCRSWRREGGRGREGSAQSEGDDVEGGRGERRTWCSWVRRERRWTPGAKVES